VTEHTAQLIVDTASIYAVAGLVFAAVFVTRLVGRIDPSAVDGTWGFRLVIVPGVIVFWPYLLGRLLRGAVAPPAEWTAHRAAARRPAWLGRATPARDGREAPPHDREGVGREP
jgi:hypothetical protein